MLRPYKKSLTLGLILVALFLSLRLVTPLLIPILVDDVMKAGQFGPTEQQLLYKVLAGLIALAISRAAFIYARSIIFEKISQNITYDMRVGMYEHLHTLPYRFYDRHRVGEIMSRMTGDIESVRNFFAIGIIQIVETIVYYLGSAIIIMCLSFKVGLVLLLVTPIIAAIAYKFDKTIRPAFQQIREQNATLSNRTQENIAGARVVKAYAREQHEEKLFDKENKKQRNLGIKITTIFSNFHPIIELVASIIPALLLLVGGYLAAQGAVTTGTLIAIFNYLWMLTMPMRMVGNILNMTSQTIASGERIFYYMDFGAYIREKNNAQYPEEFRGHVTFEDVCFSYGDEEVLTDISFDVKPGKTLAIMGATGSGKTSIVNLLGRFYECHHGAVKIDGIDVKDYKMKALRKNIGYVMQETFLFSDSLGGNIAFGDPDADQSAIEDAAEIAQARPFIEEIDEGYDLIVGERGNGLSGGQKQRTAIARSLLINPKILVLDDATAAVDMETEHRIQQGLKRATEDRTTFIISHRIASVKNADEIIVLDGGKIAERGVHDELLQKKGLYYNIFMDQYRDYLSIHGKEVS